MKTFLLFSLRVVSGAVQQLLLLPGFLMESLEIQLGFCLRSSLDIPLCAGGILLPKYISFFQFLLLGRFFSPKYLVILILRNRFSEIRGMNMNMNMNMSE